MVVDLQKYILAKTVANKDLDLFLSLYSNWFTGLPEIVYNTLKSYHTDTGRVANVDELVVINADCLPLETWITSYADIELADDLVLGELESDFARNSVLDFIIEATSSIKDKSSEELVASLADLQQEINVSSTQTKDTITDALDSDYINDDCELILSGFSSQYDRDVGGFAFGELIVVGGERGSGKSIITQNLTNYHYQAHSNTVAYFNIEMSKSNVEKRFLSQISGVSYNDIRRKTLSERQKATIEIAKARYFYESSADMDMLQTEFSQSRISLEDFKKTLKDLTRNEHKYFNIDDASLTMEKLEQTVARLVGDYNLRFVNIDYINIIKDGGNKDQDWLVQQRKAERLKEIAKTYDIIMLTPYQIHSDGSAKRAKAIEDSVDRSFKFFPKLNSETGLPENSIKVYQAKARDNEAFPFFVGMDWQCLRLQPEAGDSFEDKERNSLTMA